MFRARDTKLKRDVAVKVIPDTLALEPDRISRFTREAQVLASLNHPHTAAIYGFEDGGETHALVLELVEGETLADRVARGPIPLLPSPPLERTRGRTKRRVRHFPTRWRQPFSPKQSEKKARTV